MVLRKHGGPEVIERATVTLGALAPGHIRVRVRAVALNHLDLWTRRGGPHFKLEYPHRLGADIAGEVDSLGAGVTGPAKGERVVVAPGLSCGLCVRCAEGRDNLCRSYRILGENTQGGYAEFIDVPAANVIAFAALPAEEAAAVPLCAMTAWQMLVDKGGVRPGQTVVVHAAGSGVSSMAIQMAKMFGARVIATSRSEEKAKRALALGADEVIVTTKDDYVKMVKAMTGKAGADLILDHLGGDYLEKAIAAAAWGGRVVTCGATAGFQVNIDARQIFFRQVEVLGSTMASRGTLHKVLPLFASGKLRAQVDRTMPLWDAVKAHEALESGEVFGKIVLSV